MTGIVWLASYPRSGNTWVRLFLARLLNPAVAWSLTDLAARIPHAADRAWIRQTGGSHIRPDAYRRYAETHPAPVLKIHDAYRPELVPADVTKGAVYIVRDPRDVMVSLAAYARITQEQAAAVLNTERAAIGDGPQFPQPLGTWSSHVKSWCRSAPFPVLRIRFEDLVAEPLATFQSIAELVQPNASPAAVARAADEVRFDRLRSSAGAAELSAPGHGPMFRAGTAEQWRTALSAGLAGQVERTQPGMAGCGYAVGEMGHARAVA